MDLRITIKFLKSEPSPLIAAQLRPNANAFEVNDEDYSCNNTFETILCLIVKKGAELSFEFDLLSPVRRVIFAGDNLPFESTGDTLKVTLPPQQANNDRTADMHMIIPFTGVDLRLEVANPNQIGGKYVDNEFPYAARTAAMSVEFALLEAVQWLGLDRGIGLGPCGPIYLMGFDTNSPCGHTDWPPHVHLHMAKPAYGAPIGHYYFDEHLRFTHNIVYQRKIQSETQRYERGESCLHHAPDGSMLFDLMITDIGGLCLTSAAGERVFIEPIESGFDNGANLLFGATNTQIKLHIDDSAGEIQVQKNNTVSTYFFETDSGKYLYALTKDNRSLSNRTNASARQSS